jgi:hypothetical protein
VCDRNDFSNFICIII